MSGVDVNDRLVVGDSCWVSDEKINKLVVLDSEHLLAGCFKELVVLRVKRSMQVVHWMPLHQSNIVDILVFY